MSFKAAAWAISETITETTAEKMVLVILADCHNAETGRCDPSHDFIAERSRMSRRNVIRIIEQLEKLGAITQNKRANGAGLKVTTHYSLACDITSHRCDKSSTKDVTNETPTDVTPCHINQELLNQEVNQGAERSRTPPMDYKPPDLKRLRLLGVPAGTDIQGCLKMFRLQEFKTPRSDWDRAFAQWCIREKAFGKTPPLETPSEMPEL